MDKSLTSQYFAQNEHVTSVKANAILSIVDEARRLVGPISVKEATSGTSTAYLYYMALESGEDARYLGGITYSGGGLGAATRSSFTITYNDPSITPEGDSYVRWENVQFISGGSDWGDEWYATLTSSNDMFWGTLESGTIGYGNDVLLSGCVVSGFTCIRERD